MRTRAERRHHHTRMLEKVKKFFWMREKFWHGTEEERELHLKKMAETRHPCSCHVCRNPRHSGFHKGKEKMTMQERRQEFKHGDDENNW